MMKTTGFVTLICILLCACRLFSAGDSTVSFVRIGASAAAMSMANASGLSADESSAVFDNPASMAGATTVHLSFLDAEWIADTRLNSVYYTQPLAKGWLSAGLLLLTSADFPLYSATGETVNGNLSAVEAAFSGSCAFKLDKTGFGVTVRYLSSSLMFRQASYLASDFGAVWREKGLTIGLAVRNLGFSLKGFGDGDILPLSADLDSSWAVSLGKAGRFLLAGKGSWFVNDAQFKAGVGLEYGLFNALFLRTGCGLNNGRVAWSAGCGIGFKDSSDRYSLRIDYAYLPTFAFGPSHAISLCVRYNPVKAEVPVKPDRKPPINIDMETR